MESDISNNKTKRPLFFNDAKPVNISGLLCTLKKAKQEQINQQLNILLRNEENLYNFVENHINTKLDDIPNLVLKLQDQFLRLKNTKHIINPIVDRSIIFYFQYSIVYTLNNILNKNRINVDQDILVLVCTLGIFNLIEKKSNVSFVTYVLLIVFVVVKAISKLTKN